MAFTLSGELKYELPIRALTPNRRSHKDKIKKKRMLGWRPNSTERSSVGCPSVWERRRSAYYKILIKLFLLFYILYLAFFRLYKFSPCYVEVHTLSLLIMLRLGVIQPKHVTGGIVQS